jgi:uncharacterized protein (DUF927 family)
MQKSKPDLELNTFIVDDVNAEINSLRHHFNSFIIPYSMGAQYLIKTYVSKGELFMFQNEITSCFRN